jgi:hypothetical protein
MNEEDYEKLKKEVEKGSKENYIIKSGEIYKKEEEKLLKVIRRYEWESVMYIIHDSVIGGHFGVKATQERAKDKYCWKGMMKDIQEYVRSCDKCQRRGKPQGRNELRNIGVKEPFYKIGIDIVGPLKITERKNKYIVVAADYFTKWPEAKALEKADGKEVGRFIFEDIVCRHGCPKEILSDRGTHFNNELVKELLKNLGIKHKFSTPYHPKTNGLVERFNKTLCEALAKKENREDWDLEIPGVLLAYRTKIQSSTKITPFYTVYGRKCRLPISEEIIKEITMEGRLQYLIDKLPEERNQIKENIMESQRKQKDYHDRKYKRKTDFEIGDKVLLYDAAKEKQWSGKLEDKWKGPYYIQQKMFNGAYKLKDMQGRILKTPTNGELLKEYFSRENYEPMIIV